MISFKIGTFISDFNGWHHFSELDASDRGDSHPA